MNKRCIKCNIIKGIDSFGRFNRNGKVFSRGSCKECERIKHRNRYWADVEKSRERLRQRRINNKKRYLESNSRSKKKNREKEAKYKKLSYLRNRDKQSNIKKLLHIANKKYPIESIANKQNNLCYYCGEKFIKKPQRDHVVPFNRGGSNNKGNMVATCALCNQRKGTMLIVEYKKHCKIMGYKIIL